METPFQGDTLDMPGLSYVSGGAELSLRMVNGNSSEHSTGGAMQLMQQIDTKRLLGDIRRRDRTSADGRLEEEEEEEGDDGGE